MTWTAAEPRPGFWMVKVAHRCPFVAARIWECDHEPDEPDNKVDQPYWQGQIGLDRAPPGIIWGMVEFIESSPEQQAALANPPLSDRAPRNGRAPAFKRAPLAKWRREQARWITQREYEAEIEWLAWARRNAPTHPDYTWRKPVDHKAMPVPRFGVAYKC